MALGVEQRDVRRMFLCHGLVLCSLPPTCRLGVRRH
jgi:hypothetical protein